MRTTLGFMQVGLDIVTSAIYKSQPQFQQTNNYQLLYITSSTYFQPVCRQAGQQRLWADGILIPNLHKALPVIGHFIGDRATIKPTGH